MKAKKKKLMLDYIDSLDNATEELQGLSDMIGYLGQIIREYTDEKGIYFFSSQLCGYAVT